MAKTTQRRPIEPDDLFRLKFLRGARLSPQGDRIVYSVSHVDPAEEEEYVALWLLSLETGDARQLTTGDACDTHARWSPDGKQIAFLSTRGDKPQIYLIPVDGGEARPLTDMPQGVGGAPVWSPAGDHIAFTAVPAAEPRDPKQPYRVTRHIYRFDMLGYLDDAAQDVYAIPAAGGEPQHLTADACHNTAPLWSPDGQTIAYTAAMVPDSHRGYLPRLRLVDLAGEVREIGFPHVGDWGTAQSAAWVPGTDKLAFIGQPHGRLPGSKDDLWVIDRQGGEPECRTADLKPGVGGRLQPDMPGLREDVPPPRVLVSADGATAFTHVQDGGTMHIYAIALAGPESWTPIVAGERSCIPLNVVGEQLLFGASTLNDPPDLFLAATDGADGGHERQVTQLNADLLAERELPTVEHLTFASTDGVPVEGWVLKPPGGEAPYPTVLYIHGGPHSGFGHIFHFDAQMLAGAGYAVLLVNQRGSSGYGDEFGTQIVGDWGNLDYKDLMAGVDAAIEQGIADPDRLGCCGLSGGGNLTCWIVGQTDRFKAAVPENPVTNFVSMYGVSDIPWFTTQEMGGLPHEVPDVYRRCSPITYAHRCTTPTLLLQGEHDRRCPPEQAEQFYTVLKANGCIVEMVRFPDSPHAGSIIGAPVVRSAQNEALLDWMNRYVLARDQPGG